jgi:hypothetical protein
MCALCWPIRLLLPLSAQDIIAFAAASSVAQVCTAEPGISGRRRLTALSKIGKYWYNGEEKRWTGKKAEAQSKEGIVLVDVCGLCRVFAEERGTRCSHNRDLSNCLWLARFCFVCW